MITLVTEQELNIASWETKKLFLQEGEVEDGGNGGENYN